MPLEDPISIVSSNETQLDLFEHMRRFFGQRWVNYRIADEGLNRFHRILAYPDTNRPPCCLVYGKANAGKSLLCERFMLEANPAEKDHAEASVMPVVMVQTPEAPRIGSLYSNILDSLGGAVRTTMSIDRKRDQVIALLRRLKTKILIIDEIHHILDGGLDQQGQFLNAIKTLSNQLRISIIAIPVIFTGSLRTERGCHSNFCVGWSVVYGK